VFAVEGQKDRVAKIYSLPPGNGKAQKLVVMAEAASPSLLKIAAWPVDLLIDSEKRPRGFIMPRVAARDIHELYSPKSRSEAFPEADFRFLVHVAANIARAFTVIHAQGHVLGDVNHGNLLVGADGTVMFIDCDSFQIGSGSRVFTCDVGVPLFTAPELHGHTFRGLVRTANHDRFGLAVLLFHLFYMGRHPLAGRYSGPGDMPIEKAVGEYRFAYGPNRAANVMKRPPGTVPLETMGEVVAQLFIRAFGRVDSNGVRPDAKTWVEALEKLKSGLQVCSQASWHHYPGGLAACPWCTVESQTGVRLFGQRIALVGPTGTLDLATLWRAISAVPDPGADPALPSEQPWHPPIGVMMPSGSLKIFRKVLSIGLVCSGLAACNVLAESGGIFAVLIFCIFACAIWPRVSAEKRAAAGTAHSAARTEWEGALARWEREASQHIFAEKLEALKKARAGMTGLPSERHRRLAKLDGTREMRQRQRYLDRFRIDRANIRGIGPDRTAMLTSYGIETAGDIKSRGQILQIPGFGEGLTSALMRWRHEHERNFRFNPKAPIDPREVDAIDRELEARRQNLLLTLRRGPDDLLRLSQEINAAQARLIPVLEKAWNTLKIAEARRNAL
jgi:DNA-binding helix-hairpin-helix protein with protein kinase domain